MREGTLRGRLATPAGSGPWIGTLVVPGLHGTATSLERWDQPVCVHELAATGRAVLALDLSGRGATQGAEDFGGPVHQEEVHLALHALSALSEVEGPLEVVSLSLGCAAVGRTLTRTDRPEVRWWLDWEGPSDREIITAGGRILEPAMGHALDDEDYWRPREALRWVGQTGVPYLRYQSARDHAQPGVTGHAMRMIRAAQEGDLPWFQLNDHPRGEVPDAPTWMPGGTRAFRRWLLDRILTL